MMSTIHILGAESADRGTSFHSRTEEELVLDTCKEENSRLRLLISSLLERVQELETELDLPSTTDKLFDDGRPNPFTMELPSAMDLEPPMPGSEEEESHTSLEGEPKEEHKSLLPPLSVQSQPSTRTSERLTSPPPPTSSPSPSPPPTTPPRRRLSQQPRYHPYTWSPPKLPNKSSAQTLPFDKQEENATSTSSDGNKRNEKEETSRGIEGEKTRETTSVSQSTERVPSPKVALSRLPPLFPTPHSSSAPLPPEKVQAQSDKFEKFESLKKKDMWRRVETEGGPSRGHRARSAGL